MLSLGPGIAQRLPDGKWNQILDTHSEIDTRDLGKVKQLSSVSIIIPAYNAADYLKLTIQSCLGQSVRPVGIHLIDDGSTDTTPELAAGLPTEVEYLRLSNGGVSRARNEGAARAEGDWFLFLDADDCLRSDAIEALLGSATEDCGVVYGMVEEEREPPLPARRTGFDFCAGKPPLPSQANLHRCAIISPGSALIRRELFERVGGFTTGAEPMEDRDLWLRCGLLKPVAFCDRVVLEKRWVAGSHGSQHSKRIYRGWLSKRHLRSWGQKFGAPVEWIPPDRELLTGAIKEAFFWRCPEILPALLADARRIGLDNFWTLRARAVLCLKRCLGSAPALPDWVEASAFRIR